MMIIPDLLEGESWESVDSIPDAYDDLDEWFWFFDEWGHPRPRPCIVCGKVSDIQGKVKTDDGWIMFGACSKEHLRQHLPDVLRRAQEARERPNHMDAQPIAIPLSAITRPRTRSEAIQWARELLDRDDVVLLDVETTGLERGVDEVIEVAIIDPTGSTLLSTCIKPQQPVPPSATRIHHLTTEDLAAAPTFPQVLPGIVQVLKERIVVGYNIGFDVNDMLAPNALRHRLTWPQVMLADVLPAYSAFAGIRYRQSLEGACREQGICIGGHRAVGDCVATLELLRVMAEANPDPATHCTADTRPSEVGRRVPVQPDATQSLPRDPQDMLTYVRDHWSAVCRHCRERSRSVEALLHRHVSPSDIELGALSYLVIEARYPFHYQKLTEAENTAVVEWAIQQEFGASWRARFVLSKQE